MHFVTNYCKDLAQKLGEHNSNCIHCTHQKLTDSTGTETWQIFSHMLVMAKSFQEWFTPT